MGTMLLMGAGKGSPFSLNPETTDWVNRVVANGGASPSAGTISAVDGWFTAVKAESGLQSAILSCCMFVPDSLVAALTPLIVGPANDPWTNTNFVAGDLTINGLIGNALDKYLDTGVVLSTDTTLNSLHMALYVYDGNDDATNDMEASQGGGQSAALYASHAGVSYFDAYGNADGRISAANSAWEGFIIGSRTAADATDIYTANSGTAWSSIVSGVLDGGTRPSISMWVFAQNAGGGFSDRRFSFASIGDGLTTAQGQALYNATQACRVALGGGYR